MKVCPVTLVANILLILFSFEEFFSYQLIPVDSDLFIVVKQVVHKLVIGNHLKCRQFCLSEKAYFCYHRFKKFLVKNDLHGNFCDV